MTEEEAAAARRADEEAALAYVLADERGRAFIWALVGKCRFAGASFAGENTHMTAFNEGRRDIGLQVFGPVLDRYPAMLTRMQLEFKAREERYHVIPVDNEGEDE